MSRVPFASQTKPAADCRGRFAIGAQGGDSFFDLGGTGGADRIGHFCRVRRAKVFGVLPSTIGPAHGTTERACPGAGRSGVTPGASRVLKVWASRRAWATSMPASIIARMVPNPRGAEKHAAARCHLLDPPHLQMWRM